MSENTIFRYLCPTLLSETDLREELKRRCFRIKGLERKSRDELTEIFIRHLVPFPQREFPNNNHGRIINQMIQKENVQSRRKEKIEGNKSTVQYGFDEHNSSSSLLGKRTNVSVSGDRLKPPVDATGIQSKKISLSRTSSSLDKVVINDRSKARRASNDSEVVRRKSTEEADKTEKSYRKRCHYYSDIAEESNSSANSE